MNASIASTPTVASPRVVWISGRNWDLGFLLASSLLVFATYWIYSSGVDRLVVNMLITLFVGGPHMFSTYTRTAMEPRFIRRYPWLFFGAITLIPTMVIGLGLGAFTYLLTIFFVVASLHVAEQFSYVAAAYARKAGQAVPLWSRGIDAGLILSSLHMPALYYLTQGNFAIGTRKLIFPPFLEHEVFWYIGVLVWAAFLLAFLIRTANEIMAGQVIIPRLLVLVVAVPVALYVPTRANLDVSFQGINAWHSFQYLALIWYMSRVRNEAGEVSLDFVDRLTRRGAFPKFYGFCFAVTVASAALILFISHVIGFPYERAYYLVVLSFLLIHYAFDHVIFTDYKDFVRGTTLQ